MYSSNSLTHCFVMLNNYEHFTPILKKHVRCSSAKSTWQAAGIVPFLPFLRFVRAILAGSVFVNPFTVAAAATLFSKHTMILFWNAPVK